MLEEFFKELILDSLIKSALWRLFAAVPLLGWGPFRVIITYFATKYGELFYEELKLVVIIQKIKITNASFESAYQKASLKLKIVSFESGVESKEYQKAKNEAKKSLADLVQFDVIID